MTKYRNLHRRQDWETYEDREIHKLLRRDFGVKKLSKFFWVTKSQIGQKKDDILVLTVEGSVYNLGFDFQYMTKELYDIKTMSMTRLQFLDFSNL